MDKFNYIEINGETCITLNKDYKKEISQKKYKYFLERSGIPNFYWNIEFDDYKGSRSIDSFNKAKYYAEHLQEEKFNHVHLYLWGDNSSQKSAVICNIGKSGVKQGLKVKFVLASNLIDKLMKVQGFTINEEIELYIKSLKESDLLIIDDIFDTKKSLMWSNPSSSPLIITAWDSFLRDVFSSKTKVLMTSNIHPEDIKEKFGESLFHLIDRNCVCLSFFDNIKEVKKRSFDNIFPKDKEE